jgi:hypothetical protein
VVFSAENPWIFQGLGCQSGAILLVALRMGDLLSQLAFQWIGSLRVRATLQSAREGVIKEDRSLVPWRLEISKTLNLNELRCVKPLSRAVASHVCCRKHNGGAYDSRLRLTSRAS